MQTSEKTDQIAVALVAFHSEIEDPDPNRTAKIEGKSKQSGKEYSYTYPYTDLRGLTQATRALLVKHGLVVIQDLASDANRVGAGLMILHSSGQWIAFPPAMLPASGDLKEWSSAVTSSRRLGVMAAFYLAPPSDDGGGANKGSSSGGAPRKATSGQIAKIKGEAGRGKIGVQTLIADVVKTYQLKVPDGADVDAVLSSLTVAQASNLIERLMAEVDRRQQATAAGADPETGEVAAESGGDPDDAIGFEDGPPGMDAEQYRQSRGAEA